MKYSLKRTVDPTVEPITLEDAKLHLHMDHDEDDAAIESLIRTAREHVENHTRRSLVEQTWRLSLDRFPCDVIELPRPNVLDIVSVTYLDPDGELQTLADSGYLVDPETARFFVPNPPAIIDTGMTAVHITYRAGFDSSESPATADGVPDAIKHAMRLLISHWFENREAVVTNQTPAHLPIGVTPLLAPHRIYGF